MAEAGKEKEKPNGSAPPDDPDKEFFEAEGVTDEEEKEAIRSRARVLRYADYRRKKDEETAKNKSKGAKRPKWYKED